VNADQAKKLRAEFPKSAIGKLPKGGVQLDYVGHAATTDRLLQVDPEWTWEPLALSPDGLPALDRAGNLWIRLTVCGVSRIGVGDGKTAKECIGDAIRNAAMRFGVALDLWAKEDLQEIQNSPAPSGVASADGGAPGGALAADAGDGAGGTGTDGPAAPVTEDELKTLAGKVLDLVAKFNPEAVTPTTAAIAKDWDKHVKTGNLTLHRLYLERCLKAAEENLRTKGAQETSAFQAPKPKAAA